MSKVYLKVFNTDTLCHVPIETLITLFTVKFCDSSLNLKLVKGAQSKDENSFLIDISTFQHEFIEQSEVSKIASCCQLPNFEENSKSCVAGLCATLRLIIKNVDADHHSRILLGFKESCLLACSEASIWTRFCEIDIVSTVRSINDQNGTLPVTLARFENHMSQPVRLHNLYKYTMSRKFNVKAAKKQHVINHDIVPEHIFTEGLTMTLADVIIFVCIHLLFSFIDKKQVHDLIPLTMKWYDNMMANEHILRSLDILCIENLNTKDLIMNYSLPVVENQSLYKSDPKRYKPRNRIFTHQEDIEKALNKLGDSEIELSLDETFGHEKVIDWSIISREATPAGGDLPNTRLQRKFQQLESLAKPVLKLAEEGDTIVDFCSGGGHLGILLAYLLPKCNIILLENKAESMNKAKQRVEKLSLNNVIFYQSNLDYFNGDFDIGTCLHACGVATDLVLQQCLEKNAAFVCCPCCYGSIQDCHLITYPRSRAFKNILDKKSHLVLGHAADQTHDAGNAKTKQGYDCMIAIDSDRKLKAEEYGYEVYLNKLTPETCSPKNHLLIGWPKQPKRHEFCI